MHVAQIGSLGRRIDEMKRSSGRHYDPPLRFERGKGAQANKSVPEVYRCGARSPLRRVRNVKHAGYPHHASQRLFVGTIFSDNFTRHGGQPRYRRLQPNTELGAMFEQTSKTPKQHDGVVAVSQAYPSIADAIPTGPQRLESLISCIANPNTELGAI